MKFGLYLSYFKAAMGIMSGSRTFGGPVQAHLVLTERCNLNCILCHFNSEYIDIPLYPPVRKALLDGEETPKRIQQADGKLDADTDRVRNCIEELIDMGTFRFEINACGEPFLHKNILEFIERLKRSNRYLTGFTNGTLLDQTTMDELIRLGFDDLKISLQAGTPETYVRIHPGVSEKVFSDIEKNLIYLAEQKSSQRIKRPKITLVFVLVSKNHDGLLDFAEFAVKTGVEAIILAPFDNADGSSRLNSLILSEKQSASLRTKLPELRSFLESNGIEHNIPQFQRIFHKGQLDTSRLYRNIPCNFGWLTPYIFPDGGVYPCSRSFSPLGNVKDQTFKEIWNGESYHHFRRQAITLNKRNKNVDYCDCDSCVNSIANFRVYKTMHPVKGFSMQYKKMI